MLIALIFGVVLGFFQSMPPMGPTNFAIISKAFKGEPKNGVAIGTGAGFMDFFYIMVAYGGFALIFTFIPDSVIDFYNRNETTAKIILTSVGCLVVVYYGIKIMKTRLDPKQYNDGIAEKNLQEGILKAEQVLEENRQKLDRILKTHLSENARLKENLHEHSEEHLKKHLDKKLHDEVLEVKSTIAKTEEELEDIRRNSISIEKTNWLGGFMTGVVLCLSSITLPASWFILVSYFKGYGIIDSSVLTGLALGIGVWIGTIIWFHILVTLITKNSHKISPAVLNKINTTVGIILIALGIFLCYKIVYFAVS